MSMSSFTFSTVRIPIGFTGSDGMAHPVFVDVAMATVVAADSHRRIHC